MYEQLLVNRLKGKVLIGWLPTGKSLIVLIFKYKFFRLLISQLIRVLILIITLSKLESQCRLLQVYVYGLPKVLGFCVGCLVLLGYNNFVGKWRQWILFGICDRSRIFRFSTRVLFKPFQRCSNSTISIMLFFFILVLLLVCWRSQ